MNGVGSPNGLRQMKKGKYFIQGGDVHFVVDEYRYRVHSYFFERESSRFKAELSYTPEGDLQGAGSSMTNAIILDQVTPFEFESFLWVFYNPRLSIYDASPDEWACTLRLAHIWDFPNVKALAIDHLQKLEIDLVDRISLYQETCVGEDILLPLYVNLASRDYTLTHEESETLGFRTAIVIFQARERLRATDGGRSPLPSSVEKEDARKMLSDLFAALPAPSSPQPPKGIIKTNHINGTASPGKTEVRAGEAPSILLNGLRIDTGSGGSADSKLSKLSENPSPPGGWPP